MDFKVFPEDTEAQCLYTSGEVLCKAGWGTFGDKILSPPEDYFNRLYSQKYITYLFYLKYQQINIIIDHFSTKNILSTKTEKMLNWMNDLHPDPNDPNNASFFEALKVFKLNFLIEIKFNSFHFMFRMLMKIRFVI